MLFDIVCLPRVINDTKNTNISILFPSRFELVNTNSNKTISLKLRLCFKTSPQNSKLFNQNIFKIYNNIAVAEMVQRWCHYSYKPKSIYVLL